MSDLYHECGIAAVYHLNKEDVSSLAPGNDPNKVSSLIPRLLLDIQNRGQLAAGMTSYQADRKQIIDTHKDVGTVTEVFLLNHQKELNRLMEEYSGTAAIGHVRYATCGKDDRSYAQPFERHHIQRSKWFSFGFNGQLANYNDLREEILSQNDFHLARETDTEILMHMLSQDFSEFGSDDLFATMTRLSKRLDGAYNIVFVNAQGDMLVARDPLGIRPLCYAIEEGLFAAASESVALSNLGFSDDEIKNLEPGHAIVIKNGNVEIKEFAPSPKKAHCFFEWIYFANVASTLDERSVYLTRKRLGEALAAQEEIVPDENTIVVPVPDTAKAAASSMAFELKIPCLEGLIRNRYVGRTFIESNNRADKARSKYTPLAHVMGGKRVFLVEDTIVRSTTMRALIQQIRERGEAKEVHVRVACPPIISPCFYGIDMTTVDELFAPKFMEGSKITPEIEQEMADQLQADSLRYLPMESLAKCVNMERDSLCQACVDGVYPTEGGTKLYELSIQNNGSEVATDSRIFDAQLAASPRT